MPLAAAIRLFAASAARTLRRLASSEATGRGGAWTLTAAERWQPGPRAAEPGASANAPTSPSSWRVSNGRVRLRERARRTNPRGSPRSARESEAERPMTPLFKKKSKLHSCFFCAQLVEPAAKREHYSSHLIEVTDENGDRAFTFECPRCGLMDRAWGGGRPDPEANGFNAIAAHLMMSHHVDDVMR